MTMNKPMKYKMERVGDSLYSSPHHPIALRVDNAEVVDLLLAHFGLSVRFNEDGEFALIKEDGEDE